MSARGARSYRATRTLLWLGLLLMAPVPVMLGVVQGFMPVARVLLLAGVCATVVVVEGTRGAVDLLALMLIAHVLVFGAGWYLVAAVAARGIVRMPQRARAALVALVLAIGVIVASSAPWYRTPFRGTGAEADLWEIFD